MATRPWLYCQGLILSVVAERAVPPGQPLRPLRSNLAVLVRCALRTAERETLRIKSSRISTATLPPADCSRTGMAFGLCSMDRTARNSPTAPCNATRTMPLAVPPLRTSQFGSPLVLSRVLWVRPELLAKVNSIILPERKTICCGRSYISVCGKTNRDGWFKGRFPSRKLLLSQPRLAHGPKLSRYDYDCGLDADNYRRRDRRIDRHGLTAEILCGLTGPRSASVGLRKHARHCGAARSGRLTAASGWLKALRVGQGGDEGPPRFGVCDLDACTCDRRTRTGSTRCHLHAGRGYCCNQALAITEQLRARVPVRELP
jgi:hypothetical protein